MDKQKKPLFHMAVVFFVLVAVNLYRRLWGTLYPNDFFGHFLIYFIYILLLFLWCRSLNDRITQRTIRHELIASAGIMGGWLVVRFIQEAFLQQHILILRLSGYLIHVPILWIPLLGFFASCSLGKGENYRINRRWYWLEIPALILMLLVLTDPLHHFVYAMIPEEQQPNLYFHPNVGLLLIVVWAIGMEAARVFMIFKRNSLLKEKSVLHRMVPFIEIILLCGFSLPYFFQSFYPETELVEFSAGISFLEVLSWEIYIYVGLIPANTQYATVFQHSTLGMQILDQEGKTIAGAQNHVEITPEMFSRLKEEGMILEENGQEVWMQSNQYGYTVWQRNVSDLHNIIRELRRTEFELQEESNLLSHELRAKSEKTSLQEKNRIYNQLTEEVSDQLATLKNLLKKRKLCSENEIMLRKICLIGTYVKQRCNLRLIEQAEHQILPRDLIHSFHDLSGSLEEYGIHTSIRWGNLEAVSPAFALTAYDTFWYSLEHEDFEVDAISGSFDASGIFTIELVLKEDAVCLPLEALKMHCLPSVHIEGELRKKGFRIRVLQGEI